LTRKDNTEVNTVLNTELKTGVDTGVNTGLDPFYQVTHIVLTSCTSVLQQCDLPLKIDICPWQHRERVVETVLNGKASQLNTLNKTLKKIVCEYLCE